MTDFNFSFFKLNKDIDIKTYKNTNQIMIKMTFKVNFRKTNSDFKELELKAPFCLKAKNMVPLEQTLR